MTAEVDELTPGPVRPRVDRLERLLAHMEAPAEVRGYRGFNFGAWRCGTAGCMAGELPAIWPELWELRPSRITEMEMFPMLKEASGNASVMGCLCDFFGLEVEQVQRVFLPGQASGLRVDAPLSAVLENLRRFIAEVKAKEVPQA